MKKIIYFLPIIVPLFFIATLYLDAYINDFDPWSGEQGLGTVGAIFFSIMLGILVPIVILIGEKILKKLKND